MLAWISANQPERIGESELARITQALAPVSPGYLRKLLRESGAPLEPLVEGVRQDTPENLERTLLALLHEYEAGDATGKRTVRALVIEAKDHAKLAARKDAGKQEAILWMLTWLENPPLFPAWLMLRKGKR